MKYSSSSALIDKQPPGPYRLWQAFWLLVCVLGPFTSPDPAAAGTRFVAPFRAYETGFMPQAVATGDFNSDGRPDLVVANSSSTISVLLGNGDGTFGPRNDLSVGAGGVSVAVGDLNSDGRLDVALARDVPTTTVTVLFGNGDGTLGAPVDFGLLNDSGRATSIAIADFNLDQHLDLIATTRYAGNGFSSVLILLGHGDETFGTMTEVAEVGFGAILSVTDWNADGAPDLGLAASGGHIWTMRGNGDGTFQTPLLYSTTTSSPVCMALGDVNADGRSDLVVGTVGAVAIHLGNGDGTLGPRHLYPASSTPTSVAISEFNGDGRKDLALANGRTGTMSVLLGAGAGSFGAPSTFPTGGMASADGSQLDPSFVAVLDANQNGVEDLVAVNPWSNTVSVHLGNGNGTFGRTLALATRPLPLALVAGDFNGDGHADLASAQEDSSLSIRLGNGDGTFSPPTDTEASRAPRSLVTADLDGNGRSDLVVANADSTISVRLASPGGTIGSATDYQLVSRSPIVAIADLNGDGRPDVVTCSGRAFPESPTLAVMLGNGDGTLGSRQDMTMSFYPRSIAIGDLNNDAMADVVVSSENNTMISVRLGNGDGTFQPQMDTPGFVAGGTIALGDVNEDGNMDLMMLDDVFEPVPAVRAYPGNGNGTFGSGTASGVGLEPTSLAVADLDHDGHLDIGITSGRGNTVSVMGGNGSGAFGPRENYGTGHAPGSLVMVDLDGNGWADLATVDHLSDEISILRDIASVVGVAASSRGEARAFAVSYPNPSRGILTIAFEVMTGGPGSLRVYDVAGRGVRTLAEGVLSPGRHSVQWDGRTAEGSPVPAGLYFYELRQDASRLTKRLAIIR